MQISLLPSSISLEMNTFRSHTIIHQLLSIEPFHPHLCPLKSHFVKKKAFNCGTLMAE